MNNEIRHDDHEPHAESERENETSQNLGLDEPGTEPNVSTTGGSDIQSESSTAETQVIPALGESAHTEVLPTMPQEVKTQVLPVPLPPQSVGADSSMRSASAPYPSHGLPAAAGGFAPPTSPNVYDARGPQHRPYAQNQSFPSSAMPAPPGQAQPLGQAQDTYGANTSQANTGVPSGFGPHPTGINPQHAGFSGQNYGQPYPMGPYATAGSPTAKAPRGRVGFGTVAGLMIASLLVGGVSGAVAGGAFSTEDASGSAGNNTTITQVEPGAKPELTRPDNSVASIAGLALQSVVFLEIAEEDGVSTGSGFVISQDGYILTNDHVVQGAKDGGTITVTFADGEEETAKIVGSTQEYDIAVIKVERDNLTPLVLGDSDSMVVGDSVIAVGAPLGLEGTVTTGIVSALNRPVTAGDSNDTSYINAIQTDAAINPGNSGGPLLNSAGEVIGINSAIAQTPSQIMGTTAGNIGLGFAISSNQAARTSQEIISTGKATYPVIGVMLDAQAQGEGVQVLDRAIDGEPAVTPDGPADKAGIKAGDVILAIDGRPVAQSDELIVAIRAKAPGDAVVLTLREGEDGEREVTVTLGTQVSE